MGSKNGSRGGKNKHTRTIATTVERSIRKSERDKGKPKEADESSAAVVEEYVPPKPKSEAKPKQSGESIGNPNPRQ